MKKLVLHPLLFAIYPILFLYTANARAVPMRSAVGPAAVTLSFVVVLWLLLRSTLRDNRRAALLVSVLVFFVFSYGHVYNLLSQPVIQGGGLGLRRAEKTGLLAAWGVMLALCAVLAYRVRRRLEHLTFALNVVAAALVALTLVHLSVILLAAAGARGGIPAQDAVRGRTLAPEERAKLPSIYYIILDGHAREDVLREVYDLSASAFFRGLERRGFYVARKSRANYCQTLLSLASSLNMTYLDKLCSRMGAAAQDRRPLRDLIVRSRLLAFLAEQGYTVVAFATGYTGTEMPGADRYVRRSMLDLNEFHQELLNTTVIPPAYRAAQYLLNRVASEDFQFAAHRKRILFTFAELPEIAARPGRKFVFAHLVCPHPPFVFRRDGGPVVHRRNFSYRDGGHNGFTPEEYREGYREQALFVHKKLLATIDGILSMSSRPPIIIVQGDHGPGLGLYWNDPAKTDMHERMSILNAYLLPGDGARRLYPEISPVNTFRLILNHYFGTSYDLLDDRSYFSTWDAPYETLDVTERAAP